MRKKMLSALLSVMTCTALFGTTVLASSGGNLTGRGDSTVDGDSTIVNPIYSVVVPTTLVFGLDAFEQNGNGNSQIYSVDFPIVNKSNVNVKVNVSLKVEDTSTAADIVFKDSAADVSHTGSARDVWFAAAVPTAITETPGTPAPVVVGSDNLYKVTSPLDSTGIYVVAATSAAAQTLATAIDGTKYASPTATAVTQAPIDVTGTYTTAGTDYAAITLNSTVSPLTFALKKATYLEYYDTASTKKKLFDTMDGTKAGSATYRFVGAINDAADWLANDIKATAVYNFNGLSEANYLALQTPDNQVEVASGTYAHALVKTATGPSATVTSGNYKLSAPTAVSVAIDYGTGNAAAAAGAVVLTQANGTALPASTFTYDIPSKVLTIKADAGVLKYGTAGPLVLAAKFTDGKTATINITIAP